MPQVPIQERLSSVRLLLLDGPMGRQLARRGVSIDAVDWSAGALLSSPETIAEIHPDYVSAGAELVTANTFRTTERSLGKVGGGCRAGDLTRFAVEMTKQEVSGDVWVAGSQALLEDRYRPDLKPSEGELEREHMQMAEYLADAGVDVILAETHPTIREAVAVARAA